MGVIVWLLRTIVGSIIRAAVWIGILAGGLYVVWKMDCLGDVFGG